MRKTILGLFLVSTNLCFGAACKDALANINTAEFGHRRAFTHPLSSGKVWKTDAQREKDIATSIKNMTKEIDGSFDGDTDTPPMIVIPTQGTKVKFTKEWEEYGNMVAQVTGAKDGVLRATVLLPVSGHTGLANAKKWAKSDTFSLKYDDGSGKETFLIKDAKSLDLITAQEVEIPLKDGKPVKLIYHRSGSLGPQGYEGGRVIELTWKKDVTDTTPTDFSNVFWRND